MDCYACRASKARFCAACVQQALAIQPDSRQALLCLVYLELRSGNTERAVDILKKQRATNGAK